MELLISIFLTLITAGSIAQSKYEKPYAFVNTDGVIAFNAPYKWVNSFNNGRADFKKMVVVGQKAYYNYGFLDTQGKEVIPAEYERVSSFKNDVTWVKKRGADNYILIDKMGKRVGDFAFKKNGYWINGFCKVKKGKNIGYINAKGEWIVKFSEGYVDGGSNSEGLICVSKDYVNYGFIDTTGTVVIPLKYAQSGTTIFKQGLARVKIGGKTGLIDKTGKVVVKPIYNTMSTFGDSLLVVAFGNAFNDFGYVDFQNNLIIKGQYESAEAFDHGVAVVSKNGKYGIIDRTGAVIVPLEQENAYNDLEERGYLRVLNNKKWTYFNALGKEITVYEAKSIKGGKLIPVYNWEIKKGGFYDMEGNLKIPRTFCKVEEFSKEGLCLVLMCD